MTVMTLISKRSNQTIESEHVMATIRKQDQKPWQSADGYPCKVDASSRLHSHSSSQRDWGINYAILRARQSNSHARSQRRSKRLQAQSPSSNYKKPGARPRACLTHSSLILGFQPSPKTIAYIPNRLLSKPHPETTRSTTQDVSRATYAERRGDGRLQKTMGLQTFQEGQRPPRLHPPLALHNPTRRHGSMDIPRPLHPLRRLVRRIHRRLRPHLEIHAPAPQRRNNEHRAHLRHTPRKQMGRQRRHQLVHLHLHAHPDLLFGRLQDGSQSETRFRPAGEDGACSQERSGRSRQLG